MASRSILSSTLDVPVMEKKPSRGRSANWEKMEKSLLKECIKEHLSIIEWKTCDTNTNKSKQLAWNKVLQRFNELNGRHRSMAELKQQWRTLKLDAKKNSSDYKRSLKQTGGGMKPPSPDINTQEIMEMIPQEFEEDVNEFDSDNLSWVNKTKIFTEKNMKPDKEIEGGSLYDHCQMEQEENIDITTIEDELTGNEDHQMTITPATSRTILKEPEAKKARVLFKRTNERKKNFDNNHVKERDIVLIECIKEESILKRKHLVEAHEWAKEEHLLKIEQLKLKNLLLKKQLNDDNY